MLSFRNPFVGASAIALVVAALGIGLMGAYAAGSPADAQRKSDEGRTLTLVSKNRLPLRQYGNVAAGSKRSMCSP